jgi:ABC-type multidrug transport system permease subunit
MARMKGDHEREQAIDTSKMLSIVWKNWLVLSRDKLRLFTMMLFPIIMIAIFGYTSGATPKYIPAAIVDYDNTHLSQAIADQIYANRLFAVDKRLGSQDEGRKLIDRGEIKALFILPKGLEDDVLAGKSATIYAIFDQSDPTVAQITKASTQVFVQQLSQSLLQQDLAAMAGKMKDAQQDLSSAKRMLLVVIDSKATAGAMAAADANYRETTYSSSRLVGSLSSTIQGMRNSVGYLIDQNEVAGLTTTNDNDAAAALQLLATGDQQASTLQQIASYQGIRGSVSKITADTGKIYASAKTIAADSAIDTAAASAAYGSVVSADKKLTDTANQITSATPSQLSLSVIEPYGSSRPGIDFLLPSMLALTIFQGATMGLGRAIAGERKDGSLTRVFMTPTSNTTIIVGTQLFYLMLEIVRSCLIIATAVLMFGVTVKGSFLDMIPIIVIYALGAVGIGMALSVAAKTQEQYMAFSMLITLPTMFLSGVFLPIQTMPAFLQAVATILPLTYAANAFRAVMIKGFGLAAVVPDLTFLVGFGILTIVLSLLMFKRELV